MRNVANGAPRAAYTSTAPAYDVSRLNLERFTYVGMMIDCIGMSIAEMIARKTSVAPWYRSLAKAKPAVVLTSTMIARDSRQTMSELVSCCATGRAETSLDQLTNEWPEPDAYCPLLCSDASIMNQNG